MMAAGQARIADRIDNFENASTLEDEVPLLAEIVEPLIENDIAAPAAIELGPVFVHESPQSRVPSADNLSTPGEVAERSKALAC